jgi:hypothetical protein
MNRIIFLLSACCFCACVSSSNEQNGTNKDSVSLNAASDVTPGAVDFKTFDTAVSFAGIWVNESYVDKVRKTRSPRQSQGVTEESCIIIPPRTLQVTRMIDGFHEGEEDIVVVKDYGQYKLYNADLSKQQREIDILSPGRIRIGDQYFTRLAHQDTTMLNWGILEELLFSGRYETENKQEVIFSEDGRVQGLDNFTRYTPVIDYTTNPPAAFDQLQLGTGGARAADFGFRFAGDTLQIFRVRCADGGSDINACDSLVAGSMAYRLLRKK